MWVEAVELAIQRLVAEKAVDLARVARISGAGQQHGTVYWRDAGALAGLACGKESPPLHEQLNARKAFAIENSPIWMDTSTTESCKALEAKFGWEVLTQRTGSRAFERFS